MCKRYSESVWIETPHGSWRCDSRSRVSVSRGGPARDAPSRPWEQVRDVAFESTSLGPESPIGYVFASPLVPVQQPVTAYASVSYTHLRAHETVLHLVCRLLLAQKKHTHKHTQHLKPRYITPMTYFTIPHHNSSHDFI